MSDPRDDVDDGQDGGADDDVNNTHHDGFRRGLPDGEGAVACHALLAAGGGDERAVDDAFEQAEQIG